MSAKAGDIFIGTAEGSAYIYDPNNVPLNIDTMTDDDIAEQAGVSTDYSVTETNTMVANAAIEAGGSSLEGSMALVISNGNSTEQNADLSAYSGKKRVSLEGGDQNLKFNNDGGNVNVENYDPSTGAGIQANEYSNIERAIANNYIALSNGYLNVNGVNVTLNDGNSDSTIVNLFDNTGKKTKVAYTHSDGGSINASGERENMLLVGNKDLNKGSSRLTGGSGDDTAMGGSGDYIDLGAGNNSVYLNGNSSGDRQGATVAMTATTGKTEVSGFNSSFGDDGDKISIDVTSASVSFKNGRLTFNYSSASLSINFGSADLIDDDNFIGESADISDITPITYEQGDYQNIYGTNNDSLKGGVEITFAQG